MLAPLLRLEQGLDPLADGPGRTGDRPTDSLHGGQRLRLVRNSIAVEVDASEGSGYGAGCVRHPVARSFGRVLERHKRPVRLILFTFRRDIDRHCEVIGELRWRLGKCRPRRLDDLPAENESSDTASDDADAVLERCLLPAVAARRR